MRAVWNDRIAPWVAEQIPHCGRGFGECRGLSVHDARGRLAAGVVFHDWWPERGLIQLSCAAQDRRWLTRNVARAVWGYAFSVARMAMAYTDEGNGPVRRIWRACGAEESVIPNLYGVGAHCVVLTLTRPDWERSRLSGVNHGQAVAA